MSKRDLKSNIQEGAFTTGNLAILLYSTAPTVRKWCNKKLLKHTKLPASSEARKGDIKIRADDALKFCKENNIPYDPRLERAADNCAVNFAAPPKEEEVVV